jgi:hypothetical protein
MSAEKVPETAPVPVAGKVAEMTTLLGDRAAVDNGFHNLKN